MTLTTFNDKKEKSAEKRLDEKEFTISKKTQRTIQIAGAAIFSAISLVLSANVVPILPRIPGWEIAYYDPSAIIWLLCFFIFGVEAGLVCTVVGSIGLFFADPTGIGTLFKFFATIPLIIVPILLLRLYKRKEGERNSQKLKNPKNFLITGIIGSLLRIITMLIFNILFFLTAWSDYFAWANLDYLGFGNITGWSAIIIFTIILNSYSSVLDLLIPYTIVFGAMDYGLKLDEKFEIW
ncbi:MAG: ECF transporter S component [Promethearchaeota archaeon]